MRYRLPLPELMLLAVALVWGCSYGVAKMALLYYPVLGFLALRFGITFVLLLPSLRHFRQPAVQNAIRAGLPLGGILLAIFLCETFGLSKTSATNAAFLISLCVVFTPWFEWQILKKPPDLGVWIAAGVALLGAGLIGSKLNMAFNLGDGLILVAALLRALMMVETKRRCTQSPPDMLALTAVQSGVLALGCLILAVLSDALPALPQSMTFWGSTLFLVLLCTLFAFFAQNYAIARSSPSRAAVLLGSEPLFGALFAVMYLGEAFNAQLLIGGGLIVLASLTAVLQPWAGRRWRVALL
ncbi:DMT family transporter [Deefgea piscis]|uniref:DMT family transporter n=1 Tax=Deefgea piscis TaxID=2739061 RepID=UPI001C822F67|nr:EamA family transporter [Deefgea piscis]QZA81380.1 DMT family transporter [Deefgea piscis]